MDSWISMNGIHIGFIQQTWGLTTENDFSKKHGGCKSTQLGMPQDPVVLGWLAKFKG
jgi:hypothetical protein